MCGIFYKSSFYKDTFQKKFYNSLLKLKHRGPDETSIFHMKNHSLGHVRLQIRDIKNGRQPMSIMNHHLIYNGELYNTEELKEKYNLDLETTSDTEVLLKCLIKAKMDCLKDLNGIYSFIYIDSDDVYIVRDPFGVKPLFYSFIEKDIIAASEMKAILNYKGDAVMTLDEVKELFGLSPSHSPFKTLFKGIYELPEGHYIHFNKDKMECIKYYELPCYKIHLSYDEAKNKVRELLIDIVKRQSVSDVGVSSFLSGGLDSSIITSLLSQEFNKLDTYSIDYEDNLKDFKDNEFERSRDEDYIGYLVRFRDLNHKTVLIDNSTLFDYLKTAVILKDEPSMTDIDASMFYLAKEIAKRHKVALSGECADEIFGGYPWYYKYEDSPGFPWILNESMRQDLLNKDIKLDIISYIHQKKDECIKEAPYLKGEDLKKIKERRLFYLNLKYFMKTLLKRKDFMTMGASLEVRVPFADKRLIEFLYNLDFDYKYKDGVEKALLRDAMKDFLPNEIKTRKKSPYPKSQSKKLLVKMKSEVLKILEDKTSIIHKLFDVEKLKEIVNCNEDLKYPWYGQLMRQLQFLMFIYEIDFWAKEYKVQLEV